jgi:DNA-binding XRE family transcriptional regulator
MKGVKINTDVFNEMLKRNHMSQSRLAKKMNLSRCTICGYANGKKSPLVDTVSDLAEIFKCTYEDLVIEEEVTQ